MYSCHCGRQLSTNNNSTINNSTRQGNSSVVESRSTLCSRFRQQCTQYLCRPDLPPYIIIKDTQHKYIYTLIQTSRRPYLCLPSISVRMSEQTTLGAGRGRGSQSGSGPLKTTVYHLKRLQSYVYWLHIITECLYN